QVLEQNPERVGQGLDVADLGPDERIQAVQRELGVADGDLGLAAEAVGRHGSLRNLTVWGREHMVDTSNERARAIRGGSRRTPGAQRGACWTHATSERGRTSRGARRARGAAVDGVDHVL